MAAVSCEEETTESRQICYLHLFVEHLTANTSYFPVITENIASTAIFANTSFPISSKSSRFIQSKRTHIHYILKKILLFKQTLDIIQCEISYVFQYFIMCFWVEINCKYYFVLKISFQTRSSHHNVANLLKLQNSKDKNKNFKYKFQYIW